MARKNPRWSRRAVDAMPCDVKIREQRLQRGPCKGQLRVTLTVDVSDDYERLLSCTMPTGRPHSIGYVGTFLNSVLHDALRRRALEAVRRQLHMDEGVRP